MKYKLIPVVDVEERIIYINISVTITNGFCYTIENVLTINHQNKTVVTKLDKILTNNNDIIIGNTVEHKIYDLDKLTNQSYYGSLRSIIYTSMVIISYTKLNIDNGTSIKVLGIYVKEFLKQIFIKENKDNSYKLYNVIFNGTENKAEQKTIITDKKIYGELS